MISALLVDDHTAVREAYRLLLSQFDINVITESESGEQAIIDYPHYKPDVVIMDLSLKGLNGLDCTARMTQRYPSAKVIIFSMHDNPNFISRAIQSGAMAYVLKSDSSSVLIEAIKQVHYKSKHYLSANIAQTLAMNSIQPSDNVISSLTPREHAIFLLLIEGLSRGNIAETLSLSVGTVSNVKAKIMLKLGAENMMDLMSIAVANNAIKHNQL